MKKLLIKVLPIALLVVLSLWAGKGLFKYEFYSTHDGLHHISRAFDAVETFAEGHFPLRWAGTLNYGCGVPIFNFFYPLLYYLVILVNRINPDVLLDLKLIDFATFFVGTIFFYLWMRAEVKDKWAALAGSILYLYAPYRFVLVFVRGSPEFMAFAILPVVLYLYALALNQKNFKKYVLLLFLASFAGGVLTISHNFTVMFLMPIILLYLAIKVFLTKPRLKRILFLAFSFISVFGLGAFFIFPAVLEDQFTKLSTPSFIYSDHFPELWQLIRSKWGYFYSAVGTADDGFSFQLGYAHWLILGVVALWLAWPLILMVRRKKFNWQFVVKNIWVLGLFTLSLAFIFLMLRQSDFIWKAVPILQRIQFPWRLLGIAVLTISALFPFFLVRIKSRIVYWGLIFVVCGLALVGNRNHLLPEPIADEDAPLFLDYDHLHYHRYTTTTFADDILPPEAHGTCYYDTPTLTTAFGEEINYSLIAKKSTSGSVNYILDKESLKGSDLILGLSYFPGAFDIKLNGLPAVYKDCGGRVCIGLANMNNGPNHISWKVVQTPIQSFFNKVTMFFALLWALIVAAVLTKYKPKKGHLLFIGILGLFLLFRFVNIGGRLGFGWDQERDAVAVSQILHGDIKLIGPRVLGDLGFFLPPYFFYLLAPFYKLFLGSPFSLAYFLGIYDLVFFCVSYLVISKLFNRKTAFAFLLFWSVNPFAVSIDSVSWNPLFVPLLFVLLLYFSERSGFVSGMIAGFGLSSHFQFLLTLPVIFKKKIKLKFIAFFLAGFFVCLIPLLAFDLKNNFLNLGLLVRFIRGEGTRNSLAFLPVWDNVVSGILATGPNRLVSIVFYLAVLLFLYIKRGNSVLKRFLYVWLLFPAAFALYGKRPSEYYFNYLLVVVSIVFAYVVAASKKLYVYLLFFAVLVLFASKSTEQFRSANFGLHKKDEVVSFLAEITKNAGAFNVSFDLGLEGDSGFKYLFEYHKVASTGDPNDPLIQISAPPDPKADFAIESVGIELPDGWVANNWVKPSF